MFKLTAFPSNHDQVVPIEVDGEVGEQDFDRVLATVEDRLTRHDKLRIYLEVKSLGKISPTALLNDLKAAVKHWNRFDKQAIVTDVSALGTAAEWIGKVIPGIDVQVFSFNERESARQWIIS